MLDCMRSPQGDEGRLLVDEIIMGEIGMPLGPACRADCSALHFLGEAARATLHASGEGRVCSHTDTIARCRSYYFRLAPQLCRVNRKRAAKGEAPFRLAENMLKIYIYTDT
ncbi:uncharacterized protein MYCFIDRAFT_172674 [Pseudocercospora fijiensis CIRAD86]|uniref:Uncharacterized protein n=1 Tax=Pseudocercospora fijiensis (strain CIRAD86) TaxID=383855 RepID=M3AQU7_PSEFD|nr:uncharacterized protein MYCFIDRAFT_172674 [Pseudocercospora fijiensis CIRAD86]EME87001.1 hypothetical protein MYCFIDRAFT_172674 [Pseudocercospora fijiensis CIRAD86]